MTVESLKETVLTIVAEASKLRDARTTENEAFVNYACIFSQDEEEYELLITAAGQMGKRVHNTKMGPVLYIDPLATSAGGLRILKIRRPDPKRIERGDADFTVSDYNAFKRTYLDKPGFSLIERPDMEMIELIDPNFNALAYFSNPPLGSVLKLDF